MFAINSTSRALTRPRTFLQLARAFSTGDGFPASMDDKYEISPARDVPSHITRPSYVGQRHQDLPPLHGPIHVLPNDQIKGLRSASNLAARALHKCIKETRIGMSLDEIDKIAHDYIVQDGSYPSAIDFMHFPKSLCTSVNDVVAHGVPNSYVLKAGDYVNLDIVCFKDGCHGDNSAMVMLNDPNPAGAQVHPDI